MNEKTKLDWMGRTLRAIRTAIRVRIYNFDSEVNFDDPIILEHLESLLHLTRQFTHVGNLIDELHTDCLLYTSPSPRDLSTSRMPSSA